MENRIENGGNLSLKGRLKSFTKSYEFSLLLALILICLIMSALSPYFFTLSNFMNIGMTSACLLYTSLLNSKTGGDRCEHN